MGWCPLVQRFDEFGPLPILHADIGFGVSKIFTAIWVTGMVGGLADAGYLLFVDVPGYVNFVPGTVMTLVSGSAILLSFWVWFAARNAQG